MVGCNRNEGLQQITFNFDDNQRDLGLNSSSYGHGQNDVIPLSELAGEHTFQEGQMHNFGVNVIGQMGNNENAIAQIEVLNPGDTPEDTPELPPGPDIPPLPEGDDFDVDPSKLLSELDKIISELEGELGVEKEALREKNEAEKRLAEALEELTDDEDILKALLLFRQVDFSAPHADVHQQVEKILSNIDISNASELHQEMKNIQQVFGKVESSLRELEDAYEKISNSAAHQERDKADLSDLEDMVDRLSQGRELREYLENNF
jgi:hypothetical protein